METGGASPGACLTGEEGLPYEGGWGESHEAEGNWWCSPAAGVELLLRIEVPEGCGLADESLRRCKVEVLEVGDAPWEEASVSTWSIECDCQPLLTFTMA